VHCQGTSALVSSHEQVNAVDGPAKFLALLGLMGVTNATQRGYNGATKPVNSGPA
jgi:hypothetical protein